MWVVAYFEKSFCKLSKDSLISILKKILSAKTLIILIVLFCFIGVFNNIKLWLKESFFK
jgi:hypothetical protein